MTKCYVILKGGVNDGHSTSNVYLSKEKGVEEVVRIVTKYNENEKKNVVSFLKEEVCKSDVIFFTNWVDFVSLVERDLI